MKGNHFKINLETDVYRVICGCEVTVELVSGNMYKMAETTRNPACTVKHTGELMQGYILDILCSSYTDTIRYMKKKKNEI